MVTGPSVVRLWWPEPSVSVSALELDCLAERRLDPTDRRSIVFALTTVGRVFVDDLGALMTEASADLDRLPAGSQAAME
jgi:DNA-binding MarR family transcriptional regulator